MKVKDFGGQSMITMGRVGGTNWCPVPLWTQDNHYSAYTCHTSFFIPDGDRFIVALGNHYFDFASPFCCFALLLNDIYYGL